MNKTVKFSLDTMTLRQMPENLMIAEWKEGGPWYQTPCTATDPGIAYNVFNTLRMYSNMYASGHHLESILNNKDMTPDTLSLAVDGRQVEVFFARGCNCDRCADELSRTLDELTDNNPHPKCPCCDLPFEMVSTVVIIDVKELAASQNNT